MKLLTRISALLPLVITLIWLQFLPDQIPAHYDFQGNINRWGSKWESLLLPGVVLLMALIFALAEKAELKKAAKDEKLLARTESNVKLMRIIAIATNLMFTGMVVVMLVSASRETAANSTKMPAGLNRVLAILLGATVGVLGNYMPKAKPNSFVGFRCGWTMFNDVTWQRCNRFAGWALMITGLAIVMSGILLPASWAPWIMIVQISLSLVISLIYAAKVYREEKAKE